jgi:16S rRNA (cytosine1402-N4)-methyltransferase
MAEKFPDAKIIGLDIDQKMLEKAELRTKSSVSPLLATSFKKEDTIEFVHDSYANIDTILKDRKADFILLDLGVNLEHFLATERGFSLKGNAPLDMRFDQGMTKTAADVVNTYPASDLQSLFIRYADFTESKAQELADTIVRERKKARIATTFELKHVLGLCGLGNSAVAVIFQAIRIEVNGELANLDAFLKKFPLVLNS